MPLTNRTKCVFCRKTATHTGLITPEAWDQLSAKQKGQFNKKSRLFLCGTHQGWCESVKTISQAMNEGGRWPRGV